MDITAPRFTNEDSAREHLEALRWPDGAECPHCGLINATKLEGTHHRPGLYQCNSCREQFTVTVGTVFERSKIGLHKWLLATHLLCASKKGMSAAQIQRMLGVTYKTAWFMMHRIREAMKTDNSGPLGGEGQTVEADETYVGGKAKNHVWAAIPKKQIVVSLVERDGRARSYHVANIHGGTIRPLLYSNVDRSSSLMTDKGRFYVSPGREFAGHGSVDHKRQEYVRGEHHTNTVEGFFSILKRGVIGTYHHWSECHMHRYLAEFDFRYSHKNANDFERSEICLKNIARKRLTYRRVGSLAA
jgi:transposase-like protein